MNAEELRKAQAPLKEEYRNDAAAAMLTLKAQSRLGDEISCRIETGKALVTAGLHQKTGGSGLLACSGDMLLESLVACAGVTLNSVATAIGVELKDAVVRAEGDLDFRGTLGVSKEAPVGFSEIRLAFDLDVLSGHEKVEKLIELTERYCVVLQTLKHSPQITIS